MADDEHVIAGGLGQRIDETVFDWFQTRKVRLGEHEYECASEEQYAEMGEDDLSDPSLPLIIVRDDGKFYEIEIEVFAYETTAEQREKRRQYFKTMAERGQIAAQQEWMSDGT